VAVEELLVGGWIAGAWDHLGIRHLHTGRITSLIKSTLHFEACAGGGRTDQLHDRRVADQRLPRQFWLMNENRRCSIRFHLLVPGGRWQTVMSPAAQLIGTPRKRTISAREVCQMDKQQNIEARPGDAERPQEFCVDGPLGSRAEARF